MVDFAARVGRGSSRAYVLATLALALGLTAAFTVAIVQVDMDRATSTWLSVVLFSAAVASGLAVMPSHGRISVSASFLAITLAAAFLGPTSAAACALLAELSAAWRLRNERYVVAFNLLASMAPALLAANLVHVLWPHPADRVGFYLVVALAVTE